jgi:hypothetical protein
MRLNKTREYMILKNLRECVDHPEIRGESQGNSQVIWYEAKLREAPGYRNEYEVQEWTECVCKDKAGSPVAAPLDVRQLLGYKVSTETMIRDFEILEESEIEVLWGDRRGTAVRVYLPGGATEYRAYYSESFKMNQEVKQPADPSVNAVETEKCKHCSGTGKDSRGYPCPACGGHGTLTKIDSGK